MLRRAELKACLEIVPGDDSAVSIESLATKYLIVDCKTQILAEDKIYYQIIRADGSTKYYKIIQCNDFDEFWTDSDVLDLYRFVKERFESTSLEGYDRLLWEDLITLFKPSRKANLLEDKQNEAPRAWYDLLSSFLLSQKFSKGTVDPSLFTQKEGKDILLYGMETSIPVDTPMVEKSKLDADPQGKEVDPTPFANADHIGCQDTRRSTSGSMQLLGDRLHIDIRYHFIKEQVENEVVEHYFVRTEYQLANIFTKALGREQLDFVINKLGMRSMSPETLKSPAEEEDE
ncbi:hypothetical protein Tco_0751657 [Tanacetum coccineum]|uniref:Uncharacterized protein n=1 Tax=Tanacetum coccineum TaxID=301880 RepID=A0ABQ4Z5T6_9ASTR